MRMLAAAPSVSYYDRVASRTATPAPDATGEVNQSAYRLRISRTDDGEGRWARDLCRLGTWIPQNTTDTHYGLGAICP